VVAARARLVRHDAGRASINAAKYKASCAASACGIAQGKSAKSEKCPILWNLHKGYLLLDYQFSRQVTEVSRMGIETITVIGWLPVACLSGDVRDRLAGLWTGETRANCVYQGMRKVIAWLGTWGPLIRRVVVPCPWPLAAKAAPLSDRLTRVVWSWRPAPKRGVAQVPHRSRRAGEPAEDRSDVPTLILWLL